MANLELKNVDKVYEDGFQAVKNINIKSDEKEFIVLVGPSGSGKSTTLRLIAGLEEVSSGDLFIDGEKITGLDPKNRNIAMVFQSYALYPHMTVRKNMTFALKLSGISKSERNKIADQVAEALDISSLMDKKPDALSGGQRQRVALGRAMVRNPKVFLLDEPLSNLDAKLRVSTRSKISNLYQMLDATFVYVTHDQTEAMTMGTRVAVMNQGQIEQFDTPVNLYYNPRNRFVAEFIGSPQMNMLEGKIIDDQNKRMIKIAGQKKPLPNSIAQRLNYDKKDGTVLVGIRPEDFDYHQDDKAQLTLEVIPKRVEQVGSDTMIYFFQKDNEMEYCARLSPARPIALNKAIKVDVELERLYLFDTETNNTLLSPVELEEI